MILEGIITTLNEDGSANISPMGPIVDAELRSFVLRPFQSSTTYKNLQRNRQAVFHVTDDVQMLARAAVGQLEPKPCLRRAEAVNGAILEDACRWYALEVASIDDTNDRTEIVTRVVDEGRQRDFFGFNRAKHAVVEAAILATRTQFLPVYEILQQFGELKVLIEKTGGDEEHAAFTFLDDFVRKQA